MTLLLSAIADPGAVAAGARSAGAVGDDPPVAVFGIRHHGPGSARSLLRALEAYQPDAVLIEGPTDADPLLRWVLDDGMVPPLALLAYAPDQPKVAAFWPFAAFSPEWQAMRWARSRGVEVGFCDLPAAMVLAPQPRSLLDEEEPAPADPGSGEEAQPQPAEVPVRPGAHDPLGAMAEAAGYDDPERWWDDVVESRLDGSSPFPMITEAMAELRLVMGGGDPRQAQREMRREAFMRQTIRAALRAGRQRVAVVCGAWHAPALTWPLPPAAPDARALRGAPKRKVALTWVPWTHLRLASAAGYGAGVASPGWYHHLWTAPDRPIVRWLTKVARTLRARDVPTSSAHVIEAVRLAETLAGLRNRPLAGLAEVTDATRAVLCDGDELAVRYVTDHLVVGQTLGSVSEQVPTVPLEADLVAICRSLRLRREAVTRTHDLDLRRSIDQARSRLFHRLRLLGLDWVVPAEAQVQNLGTFRETWASRWEPEFSIALVEAAVWGTTVESAVTARLQRITEEGSLAELTRTIETCLLADLPEALARLLGTLSDRAALDADVVHLMEALPALARAQRYGDVRGTDTQSLGAVSEVLVVRICAGLAQAVAGLDEDSSRGMRTRVDGVSAALGLLTSHAEHAAGDTDGGDGVGGGGATHLRDRWLTTLASLIDRADLNGLLVGRLERLLLDAGRLPDAAQRMERSLSHGAPASEKAAWVEGFLADGALLLIHDHALRDLLDGWVIGLSEPEFVAVLPLLRRTFGTFSVAERQSLGGRVANPSRTSEGEAAEDLDEALAAPALATVDLLLGWRDG